jgi:hypothetical protein
MISSPSLALVETTKSRRQAARWIGLLFAILAISPVFANPLGMVTPDRWLPHPKVGVLDRVTLHIHWHDSLAELRETASRFNVGAADLRGFSVLRRDTTNGLWVCDVHVVRMRGALVDKERTVTFGHEVLHCFGFRHM